MGLSCEPNNQLNAYTISVTEREVGPVELYSLRVYNHCPYYTC